MKSEKNTSQGGGADNAHIILGTLLDTTWRMFVPVVLFTLIGYGIDAGFNTQPTATVIGLAIGVISSFGLVAIQLKKITNMTNQEQDKK